MIFDLINEANALFDSNEFFEFWKLLEKFELATKELSQKIDGEVEKGVIIKGNLMLGEGSLIKAGSRIEGNVFIGENCVIGPNAYLRNGVVLGDNCFVGTSEIKNSIILSGSKVPHFSYVGDSVIGRNCNLGAGTKIANLRHDNNSVKVLADGKKIDSGRRKLGALIFDNVKTGINSSINCGAVLKKSTLVLPSELKK